MRAYRTINMSMSKFSNHRFVRIQCRAGHLIRLLLVALGSLLSPTSASADEPRPNVLFISIDDQNDGVGSLQGHPLARKPNLDGFAARGERPMYHRLPVVRVAF